MKLTTICTRVLSSLLLLMLCASLMACASGRAHQNFKNWMQRQVGRSVDDPNTFLNRYPESRIYSENLQNGNIEQQYRFRRGCQVYFEIDKVANKIINWRYEGTEQDCVIIP